VPSRQGRLTAALAALVLLVHAFVPGLHALQHRLQAAADAANGKVHVCPLHPPRLLRGGAATGTDRDANAPGRTELEECALGFALQRQQDWTPVQPLAPRIAAAPAVVALAPAPASPPASREHRNAFARGPPRP
jgi:hypothetical protein